MSLHVLAVHSLSFAGSAAKAEAWMGDNEKPPLIGGGLSPLCLQEKRGIENKLVSRTKHSHTSYFICYEDIHILSACG